MIPTGALTTPGSEVALHEQPYQPLAGRVHSQFCPPTTAELLTASNSLFTPPQDHKHYEVKDDFIVPVPTQRGA